jgi:hypothetical protein
VNGNQEAIESGNARMQSVPFGTEFSERVQIWFYRLFLKGGCESDWALLHSTRGDFGPEHASRI